MTLKELNNIRYIDGEIRMIYERVAELCTQEECATQKQTKRAKKENRAPIFRMRGIGTRCPAREAV